ncbi:HTH-like domain-containing protein [Desulfoluna spongiiphila]|uniref:HTH-like domain-containing protein n=1 Tax=Desulfoluna spongiiphila TaxID=419481 RepID=UPI00125EFFC1|nr:hypothetical protein [Desulfoluna spongiiphila]
MDVYELGRILNNMYENAEHGESVVMIHLFGIKYATEIRACKVSMKEIAKAAQIHESYGTEIGKGVRLAKYVMLKN